jgi:type I restriction enzyme, S subunit
VRGEQTQTTLGAIATKDGYGLVDGPFGSNLPASSYTPTGIPVIRGSNLTLGTSRFVADEFVFVSRETADRLARSLCRPLDIVFTKKGTLGQTGLVPESPSGKYLLSSNQMKLTVDRQLADPLFVYYYVSSPGSIEKIVRDSEATGVPKTNVTYLRDFPITLPSLPEQRAIAHILGTLDDKIELNRRMNETLEAMARSLFKSWFVDFDPVRAKAEGRDPGLPKHLADLFPDSFDDSEIGEIPRGWQPTPLLDVARLISGGTPKTKIPEYWDGEIAWASAKDVSQCGEAFLIESERSITHLGLEKSSTRLIPPNSTVVVARGATTGRFTMFGSEMAMNQTCYALHSNSGHHFWLSNVFANAVAQLVSAAHGSVFDTITTSTLKGSVIVDPGPPLRDAFESSVVPLYQRLLSTLRESRTLATLRDELLPKLISGELQAAPLLEGSNGPRIHQ